MFNLFISLNASFQAFTLSSDDIIGGVFLKSADLLAVLCTENLKSEVSAFSSHRTKYTIQKLAQAVDCLEKERRLIQGWHIDRYRKSFKKKRLCEIN